MRRPDAGSLVWTVAARFKVNGAPAATLENCRSSSAADSRAGGCCQTLNVGLVYAEAILDLGRAQPAKRSGQVCLGDRDAPEPESPCSLARASMKVDAFRLKAEECADPAGDVVDRQFADAVYVADPVVYRVMKIMKGLAGRDALTGQLIRGTLKGVARDTPLMWMASPAREYGECGCVDSMFQAGTVGPVGVFGFGVRLRFDGLRMACDRASAAEQAPRGPAGGRPACVERYSVGASYGGAVA